MAAAERRPVLPRILHRPARSGNRDVTLRGRALE